MVFALVIALGVDAPLMRGTDWLFRAGRSTVLIGAVPLSAAVQAVILAMPAVAERFDVVALSPVQVAWALALAAVPFLAVEALKHQRSPGYA